MGATTFIEKDISLMAESLWQGMINEEAKWTKTESFIRHLRDNSSRDYSLMIS